MLALGIFVLFWSCDLSPSLFRARHLSLNCSLLSPRPLFPLSAHSSLSQLPQSLDSLHICSSSNIYSSTYHQFVEILEIQCLGAPRTSSPHAPQTGTVYQQHSLEQSFQSDTLAMPLSSKMAEMEEQTPPLACVSSWVSRARLSGLGLQV